jgi:hypothetical protein
MDSAMSFVAWDDVYSLDLVYARDCWRLCGDAHCCSFSRHKRRFRLLGGKHFQELPLLPGEFEHMTSTGAVAQFRDHVLKKFEFVLDERRAMTVEAVVSHRAGCACDHDTRPTICRLYPLFPVHDVAGNLLGVEPYFGIYEELERLENLAPACKLDSIPFEQMNMFLELVAKLAKSPLHLFYLHAYRLAKRHAVDNIEQRLAKHPQSVFGLFEWLLLKERVFERDLLRRQLCDLADAFSAHYGERFALPSPSAGRESA